MKWFDNQHHNKVSVTTLPFELHRVSDTIYDEIVKRNDGYYLIRRCGVMPYTGVHNFTEFVTDGCTLVYPLPRSQQQEIKLDWTPPRTQGDFTTFVINSGGVIPEIEGTLAIDRRYVEWREDKQGQTIAVAPLNIDYNRKAYIDKIYGDEQPVGELVVDDEGNESYELAINTVEFPSLKTYDGVTHVSSHGETLSPHMEIQAKQMINGEEVLSSFEGKNITVSDSTVGEIESATLYGETLVNAIKEPRAEVVLPYSFEDGESATIENTKATGSLEGIVLKGQTLVNHCPDSIYTGDGWTTDGGYKQFDNFPTLVKGKTYTFYAPIGSKEGNAGDSVVDLKITTDGTTKAVYNTWSNSHGTIFKTFTMGDRLWFSNYAITGARFQQNYPTVMILEGEWTQESMPEYFKGIASCKMPILKSCGKNLFNESDFTCSNNTAYWGDKGEATYAPNRIVFNEYIPVKPNTTYVLSGEYTSTQYSGFNYVLYDENKNFIEKGGGYSASNNFTTPYNAKFLRFGFENFNLGRFQLEKGSVATSYEPYKSTILSTPEDVVLREIDKIQDILDCSTSELIQRVGEYQITGEENWTFEPSARRLAIRPTFAPNIKCGRFVCDKLEAKQGNDSSLHDTNGTYYIGYTGDNWLRVILGEDLTSLEQGKDWLRNNKPTIQYELHTPIIKKIDLSIVDQNGVKKDKLQTFDGVTHLSVSTPDGSLNPIMSHQPLEIPANIKPNTQYSIIKDSYTNGHDNVPFTLDLGGAEVSSQVGERVTLVTTPNTLTHKSLKPSGWGQKLTNLMVMEGDFTGRDIPYIEGMQSVENPTLLATGKNLFDYSDFKHAVENGGGTSLYPINLKSNTTYTFSDETGQWNGCGFFLELKDENNNLVAQIINSNLANRKSFTFTTNSSKQFYLFIHKNAMEKMDSRSSNFQIEKGSTATSYEPYQSNILTCNEDVALRGIGDVRDTFDAVNGVLTQSVFEMMLNDTSAMNYNGKNNEWINFDINPSRKGLPLAKKGTKCVVENNHDGITFGTTSSFLKLQLFFNSELPSSSTFTQIEEYLNNLLQSSPIKVQYMAEEPIVKNVLVENGEDLSLDETKIKLPRPLGKDEALEWNSSANHYQIIRYENGIKSAVEDCKELFNRYVVPLRDKVKTFVTSKASKLLLDLPYRKIRELTVPDNFTVVLDNENDLVTLSWDVVVGATDYDIYLDGAFLTRVNTNQYQRREEIRGHLKVRAVNDLTMSDFTEETYVLSVPNETFISLVENRYEDGHVFTVTFADYSEIETGFRVRWSPDGREESYADVAGVTGTGMVMKHTFTVPLIQDYIDIRVNSYNDTGENPIVPPIHLEMSPTPIWTYKETMGQVMLQWSNTIDNTEHYVLKYKIEGTSDYVYETILSDGYDTITGYIDLGEDDLAEVSIAGVVDGLTHVYCKPFKVGKSVDETLLPPQNFAYRAISENEFEFSWTDSYTCEREFELILSHSDGRIERIIVPSTSSSTTGRKYTYRYKLQEYGYFGVKLRMNWELGNSAYTQEYTIYYLPTVVEPPAYIRKERRENEVSLQWEAQSFVDYYALYLSINGDEVEYEVKNNHYEFRINFEEEPEIRAYIRTHFLDGKVSSSSSVLQFRPCYSPNPYMVTIVNVVTEEKVLDCNIISPEVVQDYPLYTGSISKTEVSYPVSMSSVTKFTMVELPMTSEFWGKSLETDGHILSYVCRSNVEQSRYPLNVLTYKPTENIIPILETTILNYVYEAPITTEINRVRITTIGDSITAGHPNYWAETGTGDVRSQYQYWLNRKLNGQFEIINKGYGSDTTDKMVARFDKDVLETYPQYCIIQGGTNDLM